MVALIENQKVFDIDLILYYLTFSYFKLSLAMFCNRRTWALHAHTLEIKNFVLTHHVFGRKVKLPIFFLKFCI